MDLRLGPNTASLASCRTFEFKTLSQNTFFETRLNDEQTRESHRMNSLLLKTKEPDGSSGGVVSSYVNSQNYWRVHTNTDDGRFLCD
jgi:hypothetical protein